jgi:hypothetical protein
MISQEGVSAHDAVVRQPLLAVPSIAGKFPADSQEWLSHTESYFGRNSELTSAYGIAPSVITAKAPFA